MNKVIPAGKAVKTAISLPAATYAMAEKIRRKTGESRSALYAVAIREYAKALEVRELEAKYEAGYKAHPEDTAFSEAAVKSWARTQKRERW